MVAKPFNFKYYETLHCLSIDNSIHVVFKIETNKKLSCRQKVVVGRYISTLVDYLNGGR